MSSIIKKTHLPFQIKGNICVFWVVLLITHSLLQTHNQNVYTYPEMEKISHARPIL